MVDNVRDIELGTLTSGGWDVTAGERAYEAVRVLAQSAVAASVGATTDETVLATITIPAGAMGLNGCLRIETLWTVTNSGNNKVLRWRLGGIGGTAFLEATLTASVTYHDLRSIRNRGAANSQVGWAATATAGGHAASTSAASTGTIDTSAATTVVITGQKANSGETLTLEAYTVELLSRG